MMALSMTGFGSSDIAVGSGMARWEIRSVNHRYLELSFRLPSFLNELEFSLREVLREKLARGKVDCFLKVELTEENGQDLCINSPLLEKLMTASKVVSERYSLQGSISALEMLSWPGVLQNKDRDFSELQTLTQASFFSALDNMIASREREGKQLKKCIMQRILRMREIEAGVRARLPEAEAAYKIKFEKKIEDLKLEMETDRFSQAIFSLVQKMDITEELDRLSTHLIEVERVLDANEVMGRRLDFLMQELNREANTIASKSVDSIIVQDSVQLKVLIEEMREQIQNLE